MCRVPQAPKLSTRISRTNCMNLDENAHRHRVAQQLRAHGSPQGLGTAIAESSSPVGMRSANLQRSTTSHSNSCLGSLSHFVDAWQQNTMGSQHHGRCARLTRMSSHGRASASRASRPLCKWTKCLFQLRLAAQLGIRLCRLSNIIHGTVPVQQQAMPQRRDVVPC